MSKCQNCGTTKNLVPHYIVPLNRGGRDVSTNKATLCEDCHKLTSSSLSQIRYEYVVKVLKEHPRTPYTEIADKLQTTENVIAQIVLKAKINKDLAKNFTYGKTRSFNLRDFNERY